ncbi:MAG: hypothetical protein EOP05_23510 [Proteobacteria bacterium]|nr:MAG: hypothetical protein EOP05_23510 [Pseudomonadota bacterium]
MKNFRLLFAAQFIFLAALSAISGFKIPDFKDANWDTVLFLTPIGILKNSTAESSALRSFYIDISSGQTSFETWQWVAVTSIYLAVAIFGLLFLKKLSRPRSGSAT